MISWTYGIDHIHITEPQGRGFWLFDKGFYRGVPHMLDDSPGNELYLFFNNWETAR